MSKRDNHIPKPVVFLVLVLVALALYYGYAVVDFDWSPLYEMGR